MMTVKEYAEHVDADPRTVRRWMSYGLLKFTRPKGHRARLIDSAQPRPKKKGTRSANPAKQNIKSVVNVPRQIFKRPASISGQVYKPSSNYEVISHPRERKARPLKNPVFEKAKMKSLRPEPVKHRSVSLDPVSDDSDGFCDWFSIEFGKKLIGFGLLLWALPKLLPRILSQMR